MSRSSGFALLTLTLLPAGIQAQLKVPIAPSRPVTDTYFGTTVADPYRWMGTEGPELLDYMKAENAVTEESLKPFATQNAAILAELTKLEDAVPLVRSITRTLDQYSYLETPPGKSDAQLKTRPVAGGDGRLLLDPATMATTGQHAAIDGFDGTPAHQGS
jgi:prolyl oligopeptidase